MGRPSKLKEKQWNEIKDRHLKGESASSLAREFGVAFSTLHARVSGRSSEIKSIANQVIKAEERLYSLPVSDRVSAVSLIDDLRAISIHIAGAAKFGAMTSRRLAGIAHTKAETIDEDNIGESEDALKMVAGLTKMANMASEIPINLLRANKEIMDSSNSGDDIEGMTEEEIRAEIELLRGHRVER